MKHLTLSPGTVEPPTRDSATPPQALPDAKETKLHPTKSGEENARLMFVGTATVILEWAGIRIMTDPNFLHAGDHVHLGPGVQGTRKTNPAVDLHDLPKIDAVLLSHYHADHFDQHVEASLRRSLPIITTPHAKSHLSEKPDGEAFTAVHDLDFFDEMIIDIDSDRKPSSSNDSVPAVKVIGMPGKHVPPGPGNVMGAMNDLLAAVPPTNGWMLELGSRKPASSSSSSSEDDPAANFQSSYRIYISGDTLLVPELDEIPRRYPHVDLMLVHLGGTTIPGPNMPLLMVTMDAQMGLRLVQLIKPDVTVPIHYDDYDVFCSPLEDFRREVEQAGWSDRVVFLDRGDEYRFAVKEVAA